MKFRHLDYSDRGIINRILGETEYNGCEYQFAYLNAWCDYFNCKTMRIAEENGVIYIYFLSRDPKISGAPVFLPPLTRSGNISSAYGALTDYCAERSVNLNVTQAPLEHVLALQGQEYNFDNKPDNAEYLYKPSDLIELSGKKYHSKRNHIAKFKSLYSFRTREYTDGDYDLVLNLFEQWSDNKGHEYAREFSALTSYLSNVGTCELKTMLLFVGDELAAFSLGEITASNLGIVHIEKANIDFNGAYATINNAFATEYFSGVRLINRQEDMGIEGLRKAKLSYHPCAMCEKWFISKEVKK